MLRTSLIESPNGLKAVDVIFEGDTGFTFINTTPHEIRFLDPITDVEFVVPQSGILVNAKPKEEIMSTDGPINFVKTVFVKDEAGDQTINQIKNTFKNPIIIGSIIAAQAYPGQVVAMTPHPDFMRVPPQEKRMNPRKFTVFG